MDRPERFPRPYLFLSRWKPNDLKTNSAT
jgi:hypothetical protein